MQQGISEPLLYGDLVYKFKRIAGKTNFSDQFEKINKHFKTVGYTLSNISNWPPHIFTLVLKVRFVFSYNMKYTTETISICIFVCLNMFLTTEI